MRSAPDTASIQVAVFADEHLIRRRIESALIAGGHELVVSSSSAAELAEAARSAASCDVVVLACALEPFTTARQIAALRAQLPGAPLVLVAIGFLTSAVRKLISADVEGLVHEPDIERALNATVSAVMRNQLCVPAVTRHALAQPVFSHREKQVLELVLEGLTNGEIAARMYLSESTVKSHLASSFRKLGVSSRAEAARRLSDSDTSHDFPLSPLPPIHSDCGAY